jgi:hypothetical protein
MMRDFIRGVDGKTYPAWRLDIDALLDCIGFAHEKHHAGASVRGVQRVLGEHGLRRSVGTVHHWLTDYCCAECSSAPLRTPDRSGVQVSAFAPPEQADPCKAP